MIVIRELDKACILIPNILPLGQSEERRGEGPGAGTPAPLRPRGVGRRPNEEES